MAHELNMEDDGILRISLSGDLDKSVIENLRQDYSTYMAASTQENPLNNVIFASQLCKISSSARRFFAELNQDTRYGLVAFIDAPRRARVLSKFILKATKRDNIQFFGDEEEALSWIKSHT